MSTLDSPSELGSEGEVSLGAIRFLVRSAPLLMLILALSSCKKDPDPALVNCRIELARLEGILSGVEIDHEVGKVDDLGACLTSMARVEGIMRGAAMRSDDVRIRLQAMGVEASFNLPGAKKYPGLSGSGEDSVTHRVERTTKKVTGEKAPDPIGESDSFVDRPEAYFTYLTKMYEIELGKIRGKMQPYQSRLEEVEALEEDIEADRLRRLKTGPKIKEELQAARDTSSIFYEGTSMRDDSDENVERLEREQNTNAQFPDLDPPEDASVLGRRDKIPISMLKRLLKSKLAPLKRKEAYYDDQLKRSRYWLAETRALRK